MSTSLSDGSLVINDEKAPAQHSKGLRLADYSSGFMASLAIRHVSSVTMTTQ